MFHSAILDVTIGILFVFVLVSTLCSAIREGIEAWLKTRAAYLEYGIRELLYDPEGKGLAGSLYRHPLVHALYRGDYTAGRAKAMPTSWASGRGLPSYLPARTFASALMDLAARGPVNDAVSGSPDLPQTTLQSLRQSVESLRNPPVQRALLSAIDAAQGSLDEARANIEQWYDGAMERVGGWYKRASQKVIFIVALAVVATMNLNTISIAQHLYRDDTARAALLAAAENSSSEHSYDQASRQLDGLALPIGWGDGWGAPLADAQKTSEQKAMGFQLWNDLLAPILGLLITALAATLGAPVWFDLMSKVIVLRATIKPSQVTPPRSAEPKLAWAAGPDLVGAPVREPPADAPPQRVRDAVATADFDEEHDACGLLADETTWTADEHLPEARGGVEA